MLTPFDWQEGIGNRASYIEGKIAQGSPVLAVSLDAGILIFTYKRQSAKIFEIYDRLAFAGIGQQSDIEAIRVAAVEFAHREGFTRSEADVTIQRVVTAVAGPIKKAFSDFGSAPVIAQSLFVECNKTPDADSLYVIEYDGDYHLHRNSATLGGHSQDRNTQGSHKLHEAILADETVESAISKLDEEWLKITSRNGEVEVDKSGLIREILLLERNAQRESIFKSL